jgi:hypothetical protein
MVVRWPRPEAPTGVRTPPAPSLANSPSGDGFADLAKATRLARTFAFLERVLYADFSTCSDLPP